MMIHTNFLKCIAILLLLTGNLYSCQKREESGSDVTGTIIGSYANGWVELLVQIDKKYPIGKSVEYVGTPGNCTHLPKNGTYQNTIAVQPRLPLSDFPENESFINKKIIFSYREYQHEEDFHLFQNGVGNAMCQSPVVPLYIITKCQIIK